MTFNIGYIDRQLFLALNSHYNAYFDEVMWLVSSRLSWVLIALVFLYVLRDKGWRQALLAIFAVVLTVLIADQVSASVIKGLVGRPRPTHEPLLAGMVHTVNGYIGGSFGFVSSHATNSFGVALIAGLIMRSRPVFWTMMGWAALQSYSRIYLGVHYPGDALGGVALGFAAAAVVYGLIRLGGYFFRDSLPMPTFTAQNTKQINLSVLATVALIVVTSAFLYG